MYAIILTGGLLYDGTGGKPFLGNLCIKAGKIARITDILPQDNEILDVTSLVMTPGFINAHTHAKPPTLIQVQR